MQMFVRIAYWLRHPPARWQIWTMLAVALLAVIVVTVEWAGWWPDALRVDRPPRWLR